MIKSLGQIAYEAMLKRIQENPDLHDPESPPTGDPFLDGEFSEQNQRLRDDWDYVAEAVSKEVSWRSRR